MERDEMKQLGFNQEDVGELIETATRLDQLHLEGQAPQPGGASGS